MYRNLDGIYFRVKRDGKWQDICFSDLTIKEIDEVSKNKDTKWWRSIALHLKDCLNEMGEQFNIERD